MWQPFSIVVLISGHGSTLQAIIDALSVQSPPIHIAAVISNQSHAQGLARAQKAHIPTHLLTRAQCPDEIEYEQKLWDLLQKYQPDLVVLAGFMRILGANVVHRLRGKMINLHPSLLPKYPGRDTHESVLRNGDRLHGSTIHFVTEVLDAGPVIAQTQCTVAPEDTLETLVPRIKALEHVLYPTVLQWFAEGRIVQKDDHTVLMDGKPLPGTGVAGPLASTAIFSAPE